MAKLDSAISFTGKIGNLSAYRPEGSDKVIVRLPGGPSKEKIKKSRSFKGLRQRNMEFGGCGTATKCIRKAMRPLEQLGSGDFTGMLNKLNWSIVPLDTISKPGQRNIYFSRNPKLYEGFLLNETYTFDSIVKNPLVCKIEKDTLSAQINFPALTPRINFFVPPHNHPVYSFIATIGILPDLVYARGKYKPMTDVHWATVQSAWYPALNGSPAIELFPSLASLPLPERPVEPFTLMLTVGICFGTIGIDHKIVQLRKGGAAKILGIE
jgi:hypothetical protein